MRGSHHPCAHYVEFPCDCSPSDYIGSTRMLCSDWSFVFSGTLTCLHTAMLSCSQVCQRSSGILSRLS
ncbi:unnamed protein product, partial [Staurois parvus]